MQRWYSWAIRCHPYFRRSRFVRGTLITFLDLEGMRQKAQCFKGGRDGVGRESQLMGQQERGTVVQSHRASGQAGTSLGLWVTQS